MQNIPKPFLFVAFILFHGFLYAGVTIEQMQKIVDRASTLVTKHVQDDQATYLQVLRDMKVLRADTAGTAMIPASAKCVLIILDKETFARSMNAKTGEALFSYIASSVFSGRVDIYTREDLFTWSADLDVNASCLIHEISHYIFTFKRYKLGKYYTKASLTPEVVFEVEGLAWGVQSKVYFQEHPEVIRSVKVCDCGNFVIVPKDPSKKYDDQMIQHLILYWTCGQKFLRYVYGP